MPKYDLQKLRQALLVGSQEVLPGDLARLDAELTVLVEQAAKTNQPIRHYIGFEISGQIHLGTGLASALKIKQLTDCGVLCHIFLADYHTWLNNKLDGQLQTARKIAREYFAPIMLECMKLVGCNLDLVKILYAEEEYAKSKNTSSEQELTFFDFDLVIAKHLTLSRVLKSISITGKKAGDSVDFATLRYPPMQVADAFFLGAHIVHAGMDQRKAHVLMREVAGKLPDGYSLKLGTACVAPIAVHHDLLLSLEKPTTQEIQERMRDEWYENNKMSKSKPNSALFVHDEPEEIQRKIQMAYCPMVDLNLSREENLQMQKANPLLDWAKKLLFRAGQNLEIERPAKYGGYVKFSSYEELESAYLQGQLHPLDLKKGMADAFIRWLAPIRAFTQQENFKGLELLAKLRK